MLTGTCTRRKWKNETFNSTSTTLWPASSVYGTAEAATAHWETKSSRSFKAGLYQSIRGDISTMARGLVLLKILGMV